METGKGESARGRSDDDPRSRIVHDLGNVLAVALGQADTLLSSPDLTRTERRQAELGIRWALLEAVRLLRRLHRPPHGPARDRGPAPGPPGSPARRAADGGLDVLLVDDDARVRDAMALLLRRAGHRVETAGSGLEAIARCRERRFDGVVTDLTMPVLGGLVVSRAVKDHDPGTWVVLLTGQDSELEPAVLAAAGVDRVLVKPATREALLEAVGGVVPRHGTAG